MLILIDDLDLYIEGKEKFKNDTNKTKFIEKVEILQEKEKMLVTSIFSFYHNVFKRLLSKGHLKLELCGKRSMPLSTYFQ